MVTIRMSRGGAKKQPFYHVVVTDSRMRRDGRSIERVGFYNPVARGADVKLRLNLERIDYWLGKGAQTSETVGKLVKKYRKEQAAAPMEAASADAAPEATAPEQAAEATAQA